MQHTNNYRSDCEFVRNYYSNRPIVHFPNSFCKMSEKRAPIDSLQIDFKSLESRLAAKIIRFLLLRPVKRPTIRIDFLSRKAFCVFSILIDET